MNDIMIKLTQAILSATMRQHFGTYTTYSESDCLIRWRRRRALAGSAMSVSARQRRMNRLCAKITGLCE